MDKVRSFATRSTLPSLLTTLAKERIPTLGVLSSFPEAFGLPSESKRPASSLQIDQENLQQKAKLLLGCGEETRSALALWRELEERYFEQPHNTCLWVEEAALGLRQTVLLEEEYSINFEDPDAEAVSFEDIKTHSKVALDRIASQVLEGASTGTFVTDGVSTASEKPPTSPADPESQKLQLEHLGQVIHGELGFKQEPYEWVYDGLKPMLLDSVLQNHKGIHISLAAMYCAVGRRLGCKVVPDHVIPRGHRAIDVAQAGLSLATAPTPDPWLLRIDNGGNKQSAWYLDPTSGQLLSQQQRSSLYPQNQAGPSLLLRFWTGLLRVAMTAHQRRGDGDAVAHCMHQLLALDLTAPEWAFALQPAAIRR